MKRRAWVWMGLCLALPACTRVGTRPTGPEDPVPPSRPATTVAPTPARYTGFATLSGRRVPVFLYLHGNEGSHVEATLGIPELDLEAAGSGQRRDGELTLLLRYGGEACPGEVRLEAAPAGPSRLSGTLTAEDCTGKAEGPLDLRARNGEGGGGVSVELEAAPV